MLKAIWREGETKYYFTCRGSISSPDQTFDAGGVDIVLLINLLDIEPGVGGIELKQLVSSGAPVIEPDPGASRTIRETAAR